MRHRDGAGLAGVLELLGMEWNRVDWSNEPLILGGTHKSRKAPLHPVEQQRTVSTKVQSGRPGNLLPGQPPWVFARHNGERVVSLRAGFKAACNATGIKNLRIHDLRHTCAAWLVTSGVPLSEVRDLLGHSTSTARYAHLAPARVAMAVKLLDNDNTGESHFGHTAQNVLRFSGQ